jgi:O-antigen/teichoic acid export membrane protein
MFAFGTYTGIGIIAAKKKSLGNIYPSIILLSFMTGILGTVFTYLVIPILLGQNAAHLVDLARLFTIFIIINHIGRSLLAIDHGVGNFRNFNLLRIIVNPIYLFLLLLIVLLSKLTLHNAVVILLVSNAIVVCIRFAFIYKHIDLKQNIYSIKKIFKQSFSFGLADMALPLYQYLDKAILLWLLGTVSLGYYVVALTAAGVLNVVSQTIATISFTQVANSLEGVQKVIRIFRLTIIVYVGLGLVLAGLLPVLIPLVYGTVYGPSVMPAIILILAVFFQGQGYILEQSLRAAGRAFVGLEGRLGSIVAMVLLGYWWAEFYGLMGVVWAFVFAQLFFMGIIIWRFKKHFKPEQPLLPLKADYNILMSFIKHKLGLVI